MTADTYSSILGTLIMGTGNDNNSWGTNASSFVFAVLESAIAGVKSNAVTGGTLDFSGSPPPAAASQAIAHIQAFTGTLTSDQTVIMPNLSKTWWIYNGTTGAFNLYVKTTSGTATQIPQGTRKLITCDGSNGMFRLDKEQIGAFRISGKATAGPGELLCNGASLVRTEYPDLFAAIGTTWGSVDGTHFTLPLLTDTNRYLRAADGSTITVGQYQSNTVGSHNHTVTGAPSVGTLATDNGSSGGASHQHNVYLKDPGHTHTGNINSENADSSSPGGSSRLPAEEPGTINSAVTNITIGSVSGVANDNLTAAAGLHTHAITGAPGLGSLATANTGGTETRPESAGALICIVY